jgi:hypothetical protein
LPLVALLPFQFAFVGFAEAVHAVASVELQLSWAEPFVATLVGLAVSATVGATGGLTVTAAEAVPLAPAPPHVIV